jgi:hypothetical protein
MATWYGQGANKSNNNEVIGVFFSKKSKSWIACIGVNGKGIQLANRKNYEEAVAIRKQAEIKYNVKKYS